MRGAPPTTGQRCSRSDAHPRIMADPASSYARMTIGRPRFPDIPKTKTGAATAGYVARRRRQQHHYTGMDHYYAALNREPHAVYERQTTRDGSLEDDEAITAAVI